MGWSTYTQIPEMEVLGQMQGRDGAAFICPAAWAEPLVPEKAHNAKSYHIIITVY